MRSILISAAFATTVLVSRSDAQVVQLPTFRQFSVSTTVVVPDRGQAMLGGISRSRSGRIAAGVPVWSGLPVAGRLARTRSLGRDTSRAAAAVSVTVHDRAALDRVVLGKTAPPGDRGGSAPSPSGGQAAFLVRHVARHGAGETTSASQSVAAIRTAQHSQVHQRQAELKAHFDRAQRAERAGFLGAARCAYQIVARQGSGSLHARAVQRLAELNQ